MYAFLWIVDRYTWLIRPFERRTGKIRLAEAGDKATIYPYTHSKNLDKFLQLYRKSFSNLKSYFKPSNREASAPWRADARLESRQIFVLRQLHTLDLQRSPMVLKNFTFEPTSSYCPNKNQGSNFAPTSDTPPQ